MALGFFSSSSFHLFVCLFVVQRFLFGVWTMVFSDRSPTDEAKNNKRKAPRGVRLMAAVLGLAALVSCGGGDQKETFQARRVIVFGDESSIITSDGRKYTINALKADGTSPDCAANPLWIQVVASHYGLTFAECNPNNLPAPTGRIYATPQAKSTDIQSQINVFTAAGGVFQKTDLVILMVGAHDVLEQYQLVGPAPSDAAVAASKSEVAGRATALGNMVVNTITQSGKGAKVLIAKIPDLSKSPVAGQPGANVGLLGTLSAEFNDRLSIGLDADPNGGGRSGGSVEDQMAYFIQQKSGLGFDNVTDAACKVAGSTATPPVPMADTNLPTECTTATAASALWVWAGRVQFSPRAHQILGDQAVIRLRNNPL